MYDPAEQEAYSEMLIANLAGLKREFNKNWALYEAKKACGQDVEHLEGLLAENAERQSLLSDEIRLAGKNLDIILDRTDFLF